MKTDVLHLQLAAFRPLACAAVLAAAALTACGGAAEPDEAEPAVSPINEVLHKVHVGEHEVTFLLSHPPGHPQDAVVAMQAQGPTEGDPLGELERLEGPLTFAEVLAVLAPDQKPRPELLKVHALQAKALQREDTQQLKQGLAEAGTRLQASGGGTSSTPCDAMKASSDKGRLTFSMPTNDATARFLCVVPAAFMPPRGPFNGPVSILGACDAYPTSLGMTFGACVEPASAGGAGTLTFTIRHKLDSAPSYGPMVTASLTPGRYYRHEMSGLTGTHRHRGASTGSGAVTKGRLYTATR